MTAKITIEEHLANAADIDAAAEHLGRVIDRCKARGLPKGGRVMKALANFDGANRRSTIEALRVLLENEYRATARKCDIARLGFFPYRLNCPARRRCR